MANCLLTAEKEILDEQIYESWVFFFNLELMLRKKKGHLYTKKRQDNSNLHCKRLAAICGKTRGVYFVCVS